MLLLHATANLPQHHACTRTCPGRAGMAISTRGTRIDGRGACPELIDAKRPSLGAAGWSGCCASIWLLLTLSFFGTIMLVLSVVREAAASRALQI